MGLLATGTSCLALVWVMGRNRVPAPPQSTSAFTKPSKCRHQVLLHDRSCRHFATSLPASAAVRRGLAGGLADGLVGGWRSRRRGRGRGAGGGDRVHAGVIG